MLFSCLRLISLSAGLILILCAVPDLWANEGADEELVIYSKQVPEQTISPPVKNTKPQASAVNRKEWFSGKKGYEKAVSAQKVTGEPMLLYFYTTWCPYCDDFKQRVRTGEATTGH